MARISSEKAVQAVGNRYDLILIASARARELSQGARSTLSKKGGAVVTALREIENGDIGREYLTKMFISNKKHNQP